MLTFEDAVGFILCSGFGAAVVASYCYSTIAPFTIYLVILALCMWQWPRIKRFSDKMWREK